ncbi:putative long-chain-alcohol o-fatty-acyltransferase 2, partial [Quercus suber]
SSSVAEDNSQSLFAFVQSNLNQCSRHFDQTYQELHQEREAKREMDAEIKNYIKVWITAITSLCYCYYIVARIRRGMIRLFFLLPIFYLFTILPCNLNSFHCLPSH